MKLFYSLLFSLLLLHHSHCQDTATPDTTDTTTFTATDCLSYIYVAWVFFIYAVGLGLPSTQYPQVISYIYLYIPDDCGGNFQGDDAISAQNLLNILLASTNINGNTFNQNPFPSQFVQNQNENENQASSATNLISSLSGIFRSSPQVAHNLRTGSSLARGGVLGRNYQTSFKVGKQELRKDKDLYRYVRKIKNPFNGKGKAIIKTKSVKKQITKNNRKIPCGKLAKKNKKAIKICKSIRKKRKGKRLQRKKAVVKKNTENNGIIKKNRYFNPFQMKGFWDMIG